MNSENEKIKLIEKIGYSLGDLAANLIFQTLMTFLAFFYTDVAKIPPAPASVIIFIGGMVGAFFNPVMGIIADRTHTRWGKFRPWVLWTSIPFGVMAILAFTTPNFSTTGKIIYALITYILLVIVYSANNLPYAALSGVITGNMSERNSISSYRFFAVMVAQFIIQVLLLPLVLIVGHGDKAAGFEKVMMIFATVGVICFIITFLTTRERIIPKPEQSSSIKQDLSDLIHNKPWIIMLIVTVFIFITLALKGGNYVYYFNYYLNKESLASFLENTGFNNLIAHVSALLSGAGLVGFHWPDDAATSAFSIFNAGGIIFMIVGIALSKGLADKYGKRDVFGFGLITATLAQLAFFIYPPTSIMLVFITQILHGFFYGLTIPLLWAMIADVADYSEWKNNRRATAIIFSAMIFGLKAGLSIGGSLVAAILAAFGYQEGIPVQSDVTVMGIRLAMSVFPAITFGVAIVSLFFYEINKKMEVQIEEDLKKRHSNSNE